MNYRITGYIKYAHAYYPWGVNSTRILMEENTTIFVVEIIDGVATVTQSPNYVPGGSGKAEVDTCRAEIVGFGITSIEVIEW